MQWTHKNFVIHLLTDRLIFLKYNESEACINISTIKDAAALHGILYRCYWEESFRISKVYAILSLPMHKPRRCESGTTYTED